MIVRTDSGGLGNQTAEIWRHLKPDVTVALDFSRLPDAMPQGYWQYPDAIDTTWRGVGFPFDNDAALPALKTCDVVFSVETFYDQRLPEQAKAAVLYVNPELFRGYGSPTYWAPTKWLIGHLPEGTRVVPQPVATDRPYKLGKGLFHVAGRNTSYDRNGTKAAAAAARKARLPLSMTHQVNLPRMPGVNYRGTSEHYWDMYQWGDTLIMPRRYGGNCLPVGEALAAGMLVVMTDVAPNHQWPIVPVKAKPTSVRTVANFPIPAVDVDVDALVDVIQRRNELREEYEPRRLEWLAANSWDALAPVWRQALEEAAR